MIIFGYFKQLLSMWTTWVFTAIDILAFIISVSTQQFTIPAWVYWSIAGVGFVFANVQLYVQMAQKLDKYEATEAELIIVSVIESSLYVIGESTEIRANSVIPPRNGVGGWFEVENLGQEAGDFYWEIDEEKSVLPHPFVFVRENENEHFRPRIPKVTGRSRERLLWNADVAISENIPEAFAIEIAKEKKYVIHMSYWTKRIGGRSKKRTIVVEGNLSAYQQTIIAIWKERGLNRLVEIIEERSQTTQAKSNGNE